MLVCWAFRSIMPPLGFPDVVEEVIDLARHAGAFLTYVKRSAKAYHQKKRSAKSSAII